MNWIVNACVLSRFRHVRLFVTPWIVAHQAPLSMGFSRQEYWSGFAMPSSKGSSCPGIKPASLKSPALAGGFFTTSATWKANSVKFSCSVLSDSLWPHELQHARPPCPSPTPIVHPNSCPSSRWCLPAVSSSFIPFSSCPQSLPASGSFPMSQVFIWGGQSIGVSALASVLPVNTQD